MAHSQKSLRDHARVRSQPNIDNEVIAKQLEDLVKPCVYEQLAYYRTLGMRFTDFKFTVDASSRLNSSLATSAFGKRTKSNVGKRKFVVGKNDQSIPASIISKTINLSSVDV